MKNYKVITLSLFLFFMILPLGHVYATGSPGQNRAQAHDSSSQVAQSVSVSYGYRSRPYGRSYGGNYQRRYYSPQYRGYYGYPRQRSYYYSPYYRPYYYNEYDRKQDGRSFNYYYYRY